MCPDDTETGLFAIGGDRAAVGGDRAAMGGSSPPVETADGDLLPVENKSTAHPATVLRRNLRYPPVHPQAMFALPCFPTLT